MVQIMKAIRGYSLPNSSVMDWELTSCQFTPDIAELEERSANLLFIADDMMLFNPNHDMVTKGSLSGMEPFHYAYTAKSFSFVKKNLGKESFPIALDIRDTSELPKWMSQTARIRGELYAIRGSQFKILDTHRQNGVQFRRERVMINIPYKKLLKHQGKSPHGTYPYYDLSKEQMYSVLAYMYVGRTEYWIDQLKAGFFDFSPVGICEEDRIWLKKYFMYRNE